MLAIAKCEKYFNCRRRKWRVRVTRAPHSRGSRMIRDSPRDLLFRDSFPGAKPLAVYSLIFSAYR